MPFSGWQKIEAIKTTRSSLPAQHKDHHTVVATEVLGEYYQHIVDGLCVAYHDSSGKVVTAHPAGAHMPPGITESRAVGELMDPAPWGEMAAPMKAEAP